MRPEEYERRQAEEAGLMRDWFQRHQQYQQQGMQQQDQAFHYEQLYGIQVARGETPINPWGCAKCGKVGYVLQCGPCRVKAGCRF